VRVRVNPAALASLGLSLEDVRTALIQSSVNAPKGSFDGTRQSYAINVNDQIFFRRRLSQRHHRLPERFARSRGGHRRSGGQRRKRPHGELG